MYYVIALEGGGRPASIVDADDALGGGGGSITKMMTFDSNKYFFM